jgi:hypothetical protein
MLQEFIAPLSVEFLSSENHLLGNEKILEQQVYEVTSIAIRALQEQAPLKLSVTEQISIG